MNPLSPKRTNGGDDLRAFTLRELMVPRRGHLPMCGSVVGAIVLLGFLCCAPGLSADDFNRPNVAYTHDGSKLGWYLEAGGAGAWSLQSHELLINNADPSVQVNDQTLYYTRVSLQSGDWNASVDVKDDYTSRHTGMIFMASDGGTNNYQILLQFGSKQVQVLQRGSAGNQTLYSNDAASTELFSAGRYYTISAGSTVPAQFNWTVANDGGTVIASGSFTNASYTNGYAGMIKSVGDPNADECHFDNFYVREITVPPIAGPHPRLLITPADVVDIQNDINNQVEPRYSTWLQLKSRADSWSQQTVGAPYTGGDSLQFYNTAMNAGYRASRLALAYLISGNTAYAAKAREFLLDWAQATPLPATGFAVTNNFPDAAMDVSRSILGFILAYDYLYNYLSPSDRTAVENWFRAVQPTIQDGIDRWNTPFKRDTSDPRGWVESSNLDDIYFGGQLYQNHLVSHTMYYLMAGYAMGDQSWVQFAVDSKDNPRDYLELFEGMIMMAGDPMVNKSDPMNPAPQDGEIIDRYRHLDTGGNHPNGAGFAYSMLSLDQMMAMTETLYVNGLNFYTRHGAYGETMLAPFNFYADFYRLQNTSIKGGFYTGESVPALYTIAVFEVANKRYPGNPAIQALLRSVDRSGVDPDGNPSTYFCYPALTHGVAQSVWPPIIGPAISSIRWSGSDLILSGSNGPLQSSYSLRSSTNLSLSTTNWPVVATGAFDLQGQFSVTNAMNPAEPQRFYRMTQP